MQVLVHQATAHLLVKVVRGLLLLAVIDPMNLFLMHGVQVLAHHQRQAYWHQTRYQQQQRVLEVLRQDLAVLSYLDLLIVLLTILLHRLQQELLGDWYFSHKILIFEVISAV